MEFIIYAIIFIMGTVFGSFVTLAVYRIPLGLNIIYEHSFCPNCNSKLKTIDLIPIFSYLFLGGKCRHCGQKIRPRYFIIEFLSGLVFLLFAISLKMDIFNLPLNLILDFTFYIIFFCLLFIIAGIDKERSTIQKSVLLFSVVLAIFYMIYVCIIKNACIYTYIISLTGIAFLLVIDALILQKRLSQNYTINILILSLIMIIFSGAEAFYYTVTLSLFLIGIKLCIIRAKEASKKKSVINAGKKEIDIQIGYMLSVSNIFMIIISNLLR